MTHRPDLRVGREAVGLATDLEVEVLEVVVLRARDAQQARRLVRRRTGRLLVLLERIRRDHEERGAGVDDSRRAAEQRRA